MGRHLEPESEAAEGFIDGHVHRRRSHGSVFCLPDDCRFHIRAATHSAGALREDVTGDSVRDKSWWWMFMLALPARSRDLRLGLPVPCLSIGQPGHAGAGTHAAVFAVPGDTLPL
jgi:hypothetical protein